MKFNSISDFCSYEGEDGTVVSQEGELKKMGSEGDMGESVHGAYSYKDDDGSTYSITYTADENGYRPVCLLFHPYSIESSRISLGGK